MQSDSPTRSAEREGHPSHQYLLVLQIGDMWRHEGVWKCKVEEQAPPAMQSNIHLVLTPTSISSFLFKNSRYNPQ